MLHHLPQISQARTADKVALLHSQHSSRGQHPHTLLVPLKQSIIIPIMQHPSTFLTQITEEQLNNHLAHLLQQRSSAPITNCQCPFPKSTSIHAQLTLQIFWSQRSHIMCVPEPIPGKQLWLWLAYFSSIHIYRSNEGTLSSSPASHCGFFPAHLNDLTQHQLHNQPLIQLAASTRATLHPSNLNLKNRQHHSFPNHTTSRHPSHSSTPPSP